MPERVANVNVSKLVVRERVAGGVVIVAGDEVLVEDWDAASGRRAKETRRDNRMTGGQRRREREAGKKANPIYEPEIPDQHIRARRPRMERIRTTRRRKAIKKSSFLPRHLSPHRLLA